MPIYHRQSLRSNCVRMRIHKIPCTVVTLLSASSPDAIEDLESDDVRAAAKKVVCCLNKQSHSAFKTI